MPKGVIKYRKRALQVNDFSGLVRHRGITPTDIDGYIEYNGVAFLFMEGKHKNAAECYGQKLAFKHLVDAINGTEKIACAIVYIHETHSYEDVDVSTCLVSEVYWKGMWFSENKRTVIEFIESFEQYARDQGLKI